MGNQQLQQNLTQKIKSFQTVKKYNHYSILKDSEGKEYYKFLYISHESNKENNNLKYPKSNSIFNRNYLEFRYRMQNRQQKPSHLPKLIYFGQEMQNTTNFMVCSLSKLNFVIFQHPYKPLKEFFQERLNLSQPFQETQILNFVKSCILGLIQLYQLNTQWNQHSNQEFISSFCLNEQNIFVSKKCQFIISDLYPFTQVESNQNNEKILKRTLSRRNSFSNINSKSNALNLRETYFHRNLQNLVSIIDGILCKFQSLFATNRNSFNDNQSTSAGLHNAHNQTKYFPSYSFEFENLIKLIQRPNKNQKYLLFKTIELIKNMKEKQLKSDSIKSFLRKDSSQKKIKHLKSSLDYPRLTSLSAYSKNQGRKPLSKITIPSDNISKKDSQLNKYNLIKNVTELKKDKQQKRATIQKQNKQLENKSLDTKSKKQSRHSESSNVNTKIRLSLRKQSKQAHHLNKQNLKPQNLSRKNSSGYLNLGNKENQKNIKKSLTLSTEKNNFLRLGEPNYLNKQNRSQSVNFLSLERKNMANDSQENSLKSQKENKKVFLKKTLKQNNQIYECNKKETTQAEKHTDYQSCHHLNPISKKINGNFKLNSKHMGQLFNNKLMEKLIPPNFISNQGDLEYIENFSSILSNPNHTISSYGNPLTDEPRTQNSVVQQQGILGNMEEFQNIKTNTKLLPRESPILPKLSSYPSVQLVESVVQKTTDKIPDFLKQYKLPQKHLLALNNIILKQKDMIIQESFEQSEFNSFRQSIPNLLSGGYIQHQQLKKRTSKLLEEVNTKILEQQQNQKFSENNNNFQSVIFQDSILRGLKIIQTSLNQAQTSKDLSSL